MNSKNNKSLEQLASDMAELDVCVMTTEDGNGTMHSRPMSNNGNVGKDVTTFFFSNGETTKVRDLQATPRVSLIYQSKDTFITLYGKGEIIDNKEEFEKYWSDKLNAWFKDGIQTHGLKLIRVTGKHIQYWEGRESGNIDVT